MPVIFEDISSLHHGLFCNSNEQLNKNTRRQKKNRHHDPQDAAAVFFCTELYSVKMRKKLSFKVAPLLYGTYYCLHITTAYLFAFRFQFPWLLLNWLLAILARVQGTYFSLQSILRTFCKYIYLLVLRFLTLVKLLLRCAWTPTEDSRPSKF